MANPVEIYNLGEVGLIPDQQTYLPVPEAWTSGKNVRFTENGVILMSGHRQALGDLEVNAEFLMNVPTLGSSFWFYFDLEKAYVAESGVHTEVTRESAAYAATAGRNWNGTILGGIPIFNNGADAPQWWGAASPSTKLDDLPNWPENWTAKIIRAFGQYLFALNVEDNTGTYPSAVRWSHKADPGSVPSSWDFTDPTVDAGQTFLTDIKGGDILDAGLLGEQLAIYKENSTHMMRFVGGDAIFAPSLILSTAGILAANCFASFKFGTRQLVLTGDDVLVHGGTKEAQSVANTRVRRTIFSEMDTTNFRNAHVFNNPVTSEIWICYPENGAVYPTKAAIWNYEFDTWTFRDFSGVAADNGTVSSTGLGVWDAVNVVWDDQEGTWSNDNAQQMLFVDRSKKAFALDAGYLFDTQTIPAQIERRGISIDGKDRNGKPKGSIHSRKLWHRLWPKLSGGAVNISIGVQQTTDQQEPVDWQAPQFFTPGQDQYIDFEVNGRLLAIKYESATSTPWTLSGHDLEVVRVSEH
jgi:hypothetical protein